MSGNTKDKITFRNNVGKISPAATASMASAYANATVLEKIENLVVTFCHRKSNETSLRFLSLNIKGNDKFYQTPFRDDLEESGDFGVFWSLLSAELRRPVRCLGMDGDLSTVRLSPYIDKRYSFELAFQCHRFEVNQHHVSDVMPVLLKSGQPALREKAVEEMKDRRWMIQPRCRSKVMPECGPSIFYDRLKPRMSIDAHTVASIDAHTVASIDAHTVASIDAHTIALIDARSVLVCEC
ncbi:hypothetical protein F2Q69_00027801 [Brassica cretica]|uniref:Uncharacterized protein n=1 Tax=Brassica cretica TaxID=69181 RepID=A0A8S9RW30_BRACR|nr:hypothetical protein F2Q69_00027801 [Brassica cretica]